jgi:hypothetical protein
MTIRKYSSTSQETTLTSALNNSSTTMVVASASGLLSGITPATGETFTVVIDPDTALEEIVDVIAPSAPGSTTLTITRGTGVDGTTAIAHSAGAKVRHMAIGRDFREANTHIEGTTSVHGITNTAALVTLTATQTLSGKTLTSPTITGTGAIAGTFTGNLTGNVTGTVSGNAGTVTNGVYTTDTGTVTSTMIANGTIVDADVNASAAIAKTKLALTGAIVSADIANDTIVDADINTAAAIAKTKISGTAVTLADVGTVTGTMIASDTIVDADINSAAAIARTKIANPTADVSNGGFKITNLGTPSTSTDASTKAYVDTSISNLINGAPGTLDTLAEIATALNNTANFSDTVVLKTGSTMSGALAMGTNKITGMGTPTVSTDAATKGYVDGVTVAPSNLTGPITSVGSATSIASQTGTGSTFVMQTSPTLTTPVLGVATATSINGTTIPSTKTLVVTTDKLSTLAATTSAELAGVISDETGSGSLVFAISPTLVTPNLGTPSAISLTNATNVPSDATKAPLASPTFTGTVTIPAGAVITAPKIGCTYTAKTAAYTFASGDEGNIFSMNNAATQQFNIPTDATFNFAVGTEFTVFWITGAGQPTIGAVTPGTTTVISTGATSATPKLRVANSGATCKKIAANSWIIFGDLA